MEHQDAMIGEI